MVWSAKSDHLEADRNHDADGGGVVARTLHGGVGLRLPSRRPGAGDLRRKSDPPGGRFSAMTRTFLGGPPIPVLHVGTEVSRRAGGPRVQPTGELIGQRVGRTCLRRGLHGNWPICLQAVQRQWRKVCVELGNSGSPMGRRVRPCRGGPVLHRAEAAARPRSCSAEICSEIAIEQRYRRAGSSDKISDSKGPPSDRRCIGACR